MPNEHPIDSVPQMDGAGLDAFKAAIALSSCYLEFGSGGSTIYAANVARVAQVISVESDGAWCKKVRNAVDRDVGEVHVNLCDIGEVGNWGFPRNKDRFLDYWGYIYTPWACAKRIGASPDTILVDGRFRVSSFLYSLVCARVGTTILFDDYFNRTAYHLVEEFCSIKSAHGRMAIFEVADGHNSPELTIEIARHSVIPD